MLRGRCLAPHFSGWGDGRWGIGGSSICRCVLAGQDAWTPGSCRTPLPAGWGRGQQEHAQGHQQLQLYASLSAWQSGCAAGGAGPPLPAGPGALLLPQHPATPPAGGSSSGGGGPRHRHQHVGAEEGGQVDGPDWNRRKLGGVAGCQAG
jgi:hypothetical protein